MESHCINDYFISNGTILANSIHCYINPLLHVGNIINCIVITDISQEAVISIIKSIEISLFWYEDISASVMKICMHEYIVPLPYLVNSSIKQGIFFR